MGLYIEMNYEHELKLVFLKVAAGEMEPQAWAQWWKDYRSQLEKLLTRGDIGRIMPDLWEPNYAFMLKTQKGIAYYFHTQGRPVKCSDYYEKKAQEEETEKRRQAMEEFHRQTTQARERWEGYLAMHPTEAITFPWRSLLGTPPAQKPPQIIPYKNPAGLDAWKETNTELKLRLKENIQAKIVPLAKAYGMKRSGTQRFVKEINGLVLCIQFIGYFRGGGYEDLWYSIGPVYDIHTGIHDIPGFIAKGELFRKMKSNWGIIEYVTEGVVDAERIRKINDQFDKILIFLADGVFPEWKKIESLETYFAPERMEYVKATEVGPADPRTGRAMWDKGRNGNDPWCADAYLFGVWDLLSGRETEGYRQLAECVEKGSEYMQYCRKEQPGAYNDKRDPMAVLYYNAELFLKTGQIADSEQRRRAIRNTYEDVCHFMRYYHGLSKKVER